MSESPGIVEKEIRDGEFRRQGSSFRDWVGAGSARRGEQSLPAEAGRYHLYVSLACPWCHRTVIVRELAGLDDAIPMHFVAPFRDERGWAFTERGVRRRARRALHRRAQRLGVSRRGLFASDPGYADARHGAGAVGRRARPDRQQRVGRHRADDGRSELARRPRRRRCSSTLYPAALRDEID